MAKVTLEVGDVVWVNEKTPAIVLPKNHILIVVKENRSVMYAKRIKITDQSLSLISEKDIKTLDHEVKLALEAVLEALQIKNLHLNVTTAN